MKRIILLDIDGVLVQPGGYRAALRSTVQRFIGDFKIEEDLLTELERRGISSEWDMSPLIIAAYWENLFSKRYIDPLSADVKGASHNLKSLSPLWAEPELLSIPEFELAAGQYPAETAFHAGCFRLIPEELRKNLLLNTRGIHKSATMQVFQHFTLGSKTYSETYQLPAEFDAESALLAVDRPNIDSEIRARLNHPDHHLAAFTARPSGIPIGINESSVGYAPEAELALDLVGMKDIPLMAFGKLEYIAARHGLMPSTLVKPSPFQALAATLAAWTGNELAALNAAYEWLITGRLNGRFSELPKSFELIVVEDTMGGIRSVRAAGEIFRQAGFHVAVRALGLTSGIPAKAAAFDAADVPHFENWEQLIRIL